MSRSTLENQPRAERRILTEAEPSSKNNGEDTEDNDLVMREGDVLYNAGTNLRYYVESLLGCGTFGQVVKCSCPEFKQEVAVKVIKNQQAYYSQAVIEVHILKMLNMNYDPDESHLVRMLDYFTHKNHLCIVFERLHANLFEVLRNNCYHGLSLTLVKVITKQVLEAMCVLRKVRVIHCDLKPENILLVSGEVKEIDVKVIDFGSACFESKTVYSYIQSRFYRSPEVLLGHPYNGMVDVWSLGCVAAELFLGLPLFPGASDYDMLKRIDEFIGMPSDGFLAKCKYRDKLLAREEGHDGWPRYRLKTEEEYAHHSRCRPVMGKQYFKHLGNLDPTKPIRLDDVILHYPLDSSAGWDEQEAEKRKRYSFVDFLQGILMADPAKRWAPWQALQHPFITGEPFTGPFAPPPEPPEATQPDPVDIPGAHMHRFYHPHAQAAAMHHTLASPSSPYMVSAAQDIASQAAGGWSVPCTSSDVANIAAAAAAMAAMSGASASGRPSLADAVAAHMRYPAACSLGTSVGGSVPYSQAMHNAMAMAYKSLSGHCNVDTFAATDPRPLFPASHYHTSHMSSANAQPSSQRDSHFLQLCSPGSSAMTSMAYAAAAAYYGGVAASVGTPLSNGAYAPRAAGMPQQMPLANGAGGGAARHVPQHPMLGVSVGVSASGMASGSTGQHARWMATIPDGAGAAEPSGDARSSSHAAASTSGAAGSSPAAPQPAKQRAAGSSDQLGSSPVVGNEWDPFFGETSDQDCVYTAHRGSDMASELADEDTRSRLSPLNGPDEPLEVMSVNVHESHSQAQVWASPCTGGHSHHTAAVHHSAGGAGGAPALLSPNSAPACSSKGWVGGAAAMSCHPPDASTHATADEMGSHVIMLDQNDVLGTSGPESDAFFGLSFDQCSPHDGGQPPAGMPLASSGVQLWRVKQQPAAPMCEGKDCGGMAAPGSAGAKGSGDASSVRLGIAGSGVGAAFWQASQGAGTDDVMTP